AERRHHFQLHDALLLHHRDPTAIVERDEASVPGVGMVRVGNGWKQHLGLKTLSLAMALLLWSFVHGTKVVERELTLPVRFAGLPASLLITSGARATVRVLASGAAEEFALERLVPRAGLHLDLSHARPTSVRIVPVAADVAFGAGAHLAAVRVLEPAVL